MKSGTKFGVSGFFAVLGVSSLVYAFNTSIFIFLIIIGGSFFAGLGLSIFGDAE